MSPSIIASLTAFSASLLLTATVRAAARRWNIVDWPDARRKLHGRPVPLLGGVAVYGAVVLGLLAIAFVSPVSEEFRELAAAWIVAAGFVCLVGTIDDRFDLPARLKLVLQIVSVLPLIFLGYYVDRVVAFGCPIELGWLGIPLTILWLVGCINALNLIDGMDGLASIVGLSTAAMMSMIAASQGHYHVAGMAIVLAAALAGFLMYNLPPASIFLGDSGSMVIGLTVGVLGMQGTLKTSATLAITAPAVAMTLPLFDIIAAVVRRKLTGRRIDSPDRLHIHHRLLSRGWSTWQVLCLLGAICLTTGAAATAATIFRLDALAWITAMTLVVLMIRLRLFGYEEFALVKKAVLHAIEACGRKIAAFRKKQVIRHSGLQIRDYDHPMLALPPSESQLGFVGGDACTLTPQLWESLVHKVRAWNIREVEFRRRQGDRPQAICWVDPDSPAGERLGWSRVVSMPGAGNAICELRVAAVETIAGRRDLAALESLLKVFGAHFASHADLLLGAAATESPEKTDAREDSHRQAA